MDAPPLDDPPALRPSDLAHRVLADRGVAVLPEAANPDGRVTLTDAMLAIAALTPSCALARESVGLGLASLVLVLPALARTHVAMIRRRGVGASPNAGDWMVAFVSSTFRVALILDLVSVIELASLVVGSSFGARILADSTLGAWLGFFLLSVPLTVLALAYLVPNLMPVREPL